MSLSKSLDHYIDTIYKLHTEEGVRVTDVAKGMNVSKASANVAVKKLVEDGFIIHEKYGNIFITEDGIEHAKKVLWKRDIISKFLNEILNVKEEKASSDACEIEHVISDDTLEQMESFIGRCQKGLCCYRNSELKLD